MTSYREILRFHSQGLSQRSIAASCGCGKGTVQRTLSRAELHGLEWPLPKEMTNEHIHMLFSPPPRTAAGHREPDFERIHRDMAKSGVTMTLLWHEYCAECQQNDEVPYMYSRFCHMFRAYNMRNKATMHLERKPGEQLEVDWAGQTMGITDNVTGENIPAYIFVASLSYSGYSYVEAFLSQSQGDWISAHVNAYCFFDGVTRILVPDNLKTGVTKANRYNPVINRSYQEMAEHYGTAVLPARVRNPKDKASVEGTVGVISTWVIAALRNWKGFSLQELNETIRGKVYEFNDKPFQKREGSRRSVFLEEEQPHLTPLPVREFEFATWKVCTVAYNYHISVDKMSYNVPYEYIKKKVDVRLTCSMVEVFFEGSRIASHARKRGYAGQYSTV